MKKILLILIVICGAATWYVLKKDEPALTTAIPKSDTKSPPSFAEIKKQADQTAAELQEKLKAQQRQFDELQKK